LFLKSSLIYTIKKTPENHGKTPGKHRKLSEIKEFCPKSITQNNRNNIYHFHFYRVLTFEEFLSDEKTFGIFIHSSFAFKL